MKLLIASVEIEAVLAVEDDADRGAMQVAAEDALENILNDVCMSEWNADYTELKDKLVLPAGLTEKSLVYGPDKDVTVGEVWAQMEAAKKKPPLEDGPMFKAGELEAESTKEHEEV